MRTNTTLIVVTATLALSTLVGHAMTVADAPVDVLMAEADLPVHATVVASAFEPVPGPGARVRTRLLLAVWEVLAPVSRERDPGHWVEVVLPGGVLNGLQTSVPGVPRLEPGDEVVLLLGDTAWGYQPIGYALGTFHVEADGSVRPAWEPHARRARLATSTPGSDPLALAPWLDGLRRLAR